MPIVSVHIADPGPARVLRGRLGPPRPRDVPGLRHLDLLVGARLQAGLLPRPRPGRLGMVSVWENDESLEDFLQTSPIAERFADGYSVRLLPVRTFGHYSPFGELVSRTVEVDPDEPVAVLTYGRLRLRRAIPFLKANSRAAAEAAEHPAVLALTGLASPPRVVCTFSLWRNTTEMRDYAVGPGGGHAHAMSENARVDFHKESVFVRLRPYAEQGLWDGRDPLASARANTPQPTTAG